jgi:hypothetical protein
MLLRSFKSAYSRSIEQNTGLTFQIADLYFHALSNYIFTNPSFYSVITDTGAIFVCSKKFIDKYHNDI